MKTMLVSFGIYTLLTVVIPAADAQAAEVYRACQEESGRFTFYHPTYGKLTELSQLGLDSMIESVGGSTTLEEQVAKCPEEKVSIASAVKNWFRKFTEQATTDEKATADKKTPYKDKNGDFEAVLFLTQDADSILANSNAPNWHHEFVNITIGESIEALLLFRGCSVNSNGKCLVTADYVIAAPDGSTYQQALNTDVWKETASPLLTYNLTNTRIGFVLQQDAEAGVYEVKVTLSDQVSNKQISVAGKVAANQRADDQNEKAQGGVVEKQTNLWHETPLQGVSVYTE
jgi:hypothetical protein